MKKIEFIFEDGGRVNRKLENVGTGELLFAAEVLQMLARQRISLIERKSFDASEKGGKDEKIDEKK